MVQQFHREGSGATQERHLAARKAKLSQSSKRDKALSLCSLSVRGFPREAFASPVPEGDDGASAPFEAIVEYKTTPSYPLVPLEEGWIALPSVARMRCQPVAGEPRRADCFTATDWLPKTALLHQLPCFGV